MKTTSYEISEKLFKLGFEGNAVYYYRIGEAGENAIWHIIELQFEGIDKHYPSYDLETILMALPKNCKFELDRASTGAMDLCDIIFLTGLENKEYFRIIRKPNESLADTATRLLILLHEKDLVKFNNGK